MALKIIFAVYLFLQAYDFYSTNKALGSGIGKEKNPVVNYLIEQVGVLGALVLKTTLAIAGGIWLFVNQQIEILAALVVLYGYLMYNNYKVLGRK